jgi:hypothetical protein
MSFFVFRSARRHDFKNYAWPGRLSGVPTYRADPCRPIENVPTYRKRADLSKTCRPWESGEGCRCADLITLKVVRKHCQHQKLHIEVHLSNRLKPFRNLLVIYESISDSIEPSEGACMVYRETRRPRTQSACLRFGRLLGPGRLLTICRSR